jgi:Asp-tRNA(Asn)/Glu-tRNA(Gln) amidotransferase C subunit
MSKLTLGDIGTISNILEASNKDTDKMTVTNRRVLSEAPVVNNGFIVVPSVALL